MLDSFCVESGQKVSTDKSHIYFSRYVTVELKSKIYDYLQIQATNNLGKYLGFPLRHKGQQGISSTLWRKGLSANYQDGKPRFCLSQAELS